MSTYYTLLNAPAPIERLIVVASERGVVLLSALFTAFAVESLLTCSPALTCCTPTGVQEVAWTLGKHARLREASWVELKQDDLAKCTHLECARDQLAEYFAGQRTTFDLKYHFAKGTDFQQDVWKGLLTIPFGSTMSCESTTDDSQRFLTCGLSLVLCRWRAGQACGQAVSEPCCGRGQRAEPNRDLRAVPSLHWTEQVAHGLRW
jgi:hypothetical protein